MVSCMLSTAISLSSFYNLQAKFFTIEHFLFLKKRCCFSLSSMTPYSPVFSSTHWFLLFNFLICSDTNFIVAQKVRDFIFSLYCVPRLYNQFHGFKMNSLLSVCCWHQFYISNSDFFIKFYHQICIENYLFDLATSSSLQIAYDLNRVPIFTI